MRFFSLLTLITLFSCATGTDPVVQTNEVPPFIRRYKKKEKELIYVVVPMKQVLDEKSRKLIDESMRKFDPELILTNYPAEKTFTLQRETSQCEQGFGCSHIVFTCQLAKPRGIPCVTSEPYHSEILQKMVKSGYRQDEILFLYSFWTLVSMRSQNEPLSKLSEIIESDKKLLNMASRLDQDEFVRFYREKMNSQTIKLNKADIKPIQNGNYTQKLSWAFQNAFNDLVLLRIEKEQLSHEKVMVVYGPQEYHRHEALIEEFFSGHLP